MDEPVADAVRSILDGHIVLSRRLQSQGHYPAIDVIESVSRVMVDVVSDTHFESSNRIKEILVNYREAEDLINVGAYQEGNNPEIDHAIRYVNGINAFLRQGIEDNTPFQQMFEQMIGLLAAE
ncbi:TPA: hypothetical protein DCE37_20320, partial [Candidatus Latescibacteria bacterium]|nr:hypothetical protein [Candidatus Latescibacterota bacterium]